MAINKKLIVQEAAAAVVDDNAGEEGLILHLDATDIDSYDGDGDVWYDIKDHEYTPTTDVSEHFNTVLYTGNGGVQNNITCGFQPDFIWFKGTDTVDNHALLDSVRGDDSVLYSNLIAAEGDWSGVNNTVDFETDGFSLKRDKSEVNTDTKEYVAWCLKAGGAASLNEEGTIDSQVSANNDLGFSIVKTTGTSGSINFGHGLDSAPEMIINKGFNASGWNWLVYHKDVGTGKYLKLDSSGGTITNSGSFSSITSTTITNNSSSSTQDYINYCFTSKRGVSKVGGYTGANSSVFVNTGFEPAFVMIKWTSGSIGYGGWFLYDNKRDTANPISVFSQANSNAIDYDLSSYSISFNSNGFTVGSTQNDGINYDNNNYIYYAVAKNTNETSLIPDTDLKLHLDADSFDGSTNTPTTWTDSSSNSNNGTISGATFDSELGNWLDFDGSNDFVDLGDLSGFGYNLSLELWVNPDSTQVQYSSIIDFEHSNAEGWVVYQDNNNTNQYRFAVKDGAVYDISSAFTLSSNTWSHLSFTITSSVMKLYVDGNLVETVSGWSGLGTQVRRLNLGCWGGNDGVTRARFFNGKIGQVRVYSSALTQSQIRQNYNFTKPSYPNGNNFVGNNMDSSDWNSDGYFSFNGTNEYFDGAGFTPSLTDVQTVSYWVKNPTVSSTEMVMTIGQTGNSNIYSWINFAYDSTGEINASYGTTNGDISNKTTSNSAFTGNTWYHVCFLVFPENRGTSNQCFKIYIDGSEVAVTNTTTSGTLTTVQGYPIIGKYAAQNQLHFSGDLAKLKIHDRRLTEAEIDALYDAGR